MAATNKDELLVVTSKEYEKLARLLDDVGDDVAYAKDEDDTSIKDVIAHRAHWIGLFFGWYRDGQAGLEVAFPAPGYRWDELTRYTADLRARQADLAWAEACGFLCAAHGALVGFIGDASNDDLYGSPMSGARNDWPPGRWAEAAGPSHYRSAARYIRTRLRDM
jgi:hypothetical protein